MGKSRNPQAPKTLGDAGRALWKKILAAVREEFELDERELAILELACKQQDTASALDAALETAGVVIQGSQGQPRMNPMIAELRQSRLAVARLLGELELPDSDDTPRTAASRRSQHAANARHHGGDPAKLFQLGRLPTREAGDGA